MAEVHSATSLAPDAPSPSPAAPQAAALPSAVVSVEEEQVDAAEESVPAAPEAGLSEQPSEEASAAVAPTEAASDEAPASTEAAAPTPTAPATPSKDDTPLVSPPFAPPPGVAPYAAGPTQPFRTSPPPPPMPQPEPTPPPSVRKRRLPLGGPKGILKPAPPPSKAFSFRRDILQQLNSRLAQGGVNVQVPVPQAGSLGALSGTAQGTAQAAGNLIGGVFKRLGGLAAGVAAPGMGLEPDASAQRLGNGPYGQPQQQQPQAASLSRSSTVSSTDVAAASPTNTLPAPASSPRPLRRVQFRVDGMRITYPISNAIAPGDEDATRIRIEREHREALRRRRERAWSVEELERLYRECCRVREEYPLKKMRLVFQEAQAATPPGLRIMDLSFIPLDRAAIEPISDLLSINFGLEKLTLENCGLTDDGLKSILHALLVSGNLPTLSLASNRKLKYNGWRYVGIFMRRAKALRYLDLSENSINRASLEHILGAIAKPCPAPGEVVPSASGSNGKGKEPAVEAAPMDELEPLEGFDEDGEQLMPKAQLLQEPSTPSAEPLYSTLISLRLENCGLKTAALEMLAQAVRFSDLRHLSLRRNRIGQLGAVALATMLKDYPNTPNGSVASPLAAPSPAASPARSMSAVVANSGVAYAVRSSQRSATTDARGRPLLQDGSDMERSYSPVLPEVPLIVSSPGGGVTSRRMPSRDAVERTNGFDVPLISPVAELERSLTDAERAEVRAHAPPTQSEEEAISIFQAKRARRILADMPRVGNLLTLDLKGNDIRGGVTYLAQALKKNRTLRVLNLSDNNVDMSGLIAVAEALKYNSTLETLDMSHNPCSGPGLEGITTLRMAFALNSNLKRLFLNDTDLSSEGAISLAEFLPEARLIHLDLTENMEIDIAGVMALAVSVRMNKTLRCLDLNIPPNDPDFARLSRDILTACINNSERAQRRAKQPIPKPIYKSAVARAAKEQEERIAAQEAHEQALIAQANNARLEGQALVDAATECRSLLRDLHAAEEARQRAAPDQAIVPQGDLADDLLRQSGRLRKKLAGAVGGMADGALLESALAINDELESISKRVFEMHRDQPHGAAPLGKAVPRINIAAAAQALVSNVDERDTTHLSAPIVSDSSQSSPTFSIGSDEDEDDVATIAACLPNAAASGADDSATTSASFAEQRDGAGLGILEAPEAEREEAEPEDEEAARQATAEEAKARKILSEEGEIFRKAVALHIDEDDSSEEGAGEDDSAGASAVANATGELKPAHHERRASSEHGVEAAVSGEELRSQLLEADVPRSSSPRHRPLSLLEADAAHAAASA